VARYWGLGASALVVIVVFVLLGRITLGTDRGAENDPAAP
jgi:hypothetical protein